MTVHLVGAGPGDPGLLTVRALAVLQRADVVVYDRLSVAALLDLAPTGAERISVAKAPGRVTLPQDDINALLVDRGRRFDNVPWRRIAVDKALGTGRGPAAPSPRAGCRWTRST